MVTKEECRALWIKACEFEGLDPDAEDSILYHFRADNTMAVEFYKILGEYVRTYLLEEAFT